MRIPKTVLVLVIQGYGSPHGWEDESEYDRADWKQARADLREYRLAYAGMGRSLRLIRRRVPNPAYVAPVAVPA